MVQEMKKNTGRKAQYIYFVKGTRFTSIMDAARKNGVNKSTVLRWCASDKRKDCYRQPRKPPDITATGPDMTPLEFLLAVMRDETLDTKLRIQAAKYAIPYTNHKATYQPDGIKAGRQERADKAASGRFRASEPPFKILK